MFNNARCQVISRISIICLLFILFSTVAALGFYGLNESTLSIIKDTFLPASTQESKTEPVESVRPDQPRYCLSEKIADLPPNDIALFDMFTVQERKAQGLPTALLEVDPFYGDKVAYLTFDDGPNKDNTPLVLEILRKNKIKATFFVLGTQVENNAELVKEIYQDGHAIGNHTYSHVYRELYQSPDIYIQQLYHNDELIKKILGVRPRISRAPGGSAGNFTKAYWPRLKSEGYIEVGWNVSSGDASAGKANDIRDNVISQLEANKALWSHAIILMHDGSGHGETVKALPAIIQYLKEQGFTFRVVNAQTPPAW
ncbi:MAG: polysaccharide deacetylase [Pelosinus sp.]|nr:polysaccharide deacetylase [Pelosinus sp.]